VAAGGRAGRVRFRLHAKDKAPADSFDTLTVRLFGNATGIPVPLAADHSFALPRNRAAERDNADVVLHQRPRWWTATSA